MKRDIDRLTASPFDVVIIGGGIYGAAIAWESSKAGLKTALIEKDDFAQATSANSLKILHGGLRYLQSLDIKRMRDSIRSRHRFSELFPHLVRPIACILPLYGYGLKSREAMRTALFLNDLIGWNRNARLLPQCRLPAGKLLSPHACREIISGIDSDGLRGAALWYDGIVIDTERMVLELVHAADQQGAVAANYLKVEKIIVSHGRVEAVEAVDRVEHRPIRIRAKRVVNTAGPWTTPLLKGITPEGSERHYLKAVNIIVKKNLFQEFAVGLDGTESRENIARNDGRAEKRYFFFVPWRGYTMIGTTYERYDRTPDRFEVDSKDVRKCIDQINDVYPNAKIHLTDVTFFHGGLLPASAISKSLNGPMQPARHGGIIDHWRNDQIDGLISVKSVKYTTAADTAQKLLKRMLRSLKYAGPLMPCESKQAPCDDSDPADAHIPEHLHARYGRRAKCVKHYIEQLSAASEPIDCSEPILVGEVIYAIREEMALTLSDLIFRRTGVGSVECPPQSSLQRIAEIMAKELHWDSPRKAYEIDTVLNRYCRLTVGNHQFA